jgi:hypothetical protein
MPQKLMIVSVQEYKDIGLVEFSFLLDGKKYRVTPLEGKEHRLEPFYKFVRSCVRSGVSPFAFKDWKADLKIERSGGAPSGSSAPMPQTPAPEVEGEQMRLKLSRKMEHLAGELEDRHFGREAQMLKSLALGYGRGWVGPTSVAFFDELSNAGVFPDEAVTVMDAYADGISDEPTLVTVTKIDLDKCAVILQAARKHDLIL